MNSAPGLVDLARERLPAWADRIFLGDALTWEPRRFDFVRTELVYAPEHRQGELARSLLADDVAPGGRLILFGYGSPRRNLPTHPVCELTRPLRLRTRARARRPRARRRPAGRGRGHRSSNMTSSTKQ
jgi:hypothetical protein